MHKTSSTVIYAVLFQAFLMGPLAAFSQVTNDLAHSTAAEQLLQLRKGSLVVRIYMNKNKIDLLQKAIQDPTTSAEKREGLSKTLKDHLEDRETNKKMVIQAFKNNYNFSKVLFIHDYEQKNLKGPASPAIFLNEHGVVDPNIKMETDFYLLAGRGNNDESFVIYSAEGSAMPTHFPDRYNRNVFEGLVALFKKDKMGNYISKLNDALLAKYRAWKQVID
ncbi:MAG: hypothetical protein IPJ54_19910 [Saprospiraceae bacterium]|nr:hypothetical protein [Saprospiraceae bacterium]